MTRTVRDDQQWRTQLVESAMVAGADGQIEPSANGLSPRDYPTTQSFYGGDDAGFVCRALAVHGEDDLHPRIS